MSRKKLYNSKLATIHTTDPLYSGESESVWMLCHLSVIWCCYLGE